MNNGTMTRFKSKEAKNLRYCLELLMIYHLFNFIFTDISIYWKPVDTLLLYLTYKATLKLEKLYIIGYIISQFLLVIIGLSHLLFYQHFRSFIVYAYFAFELLVMVLDIIVVVSMLQAHIVVQEMIRAHNTDVANKYSVASKIEKGFHARVVRRIRIIILDVLFNDPAEDDFLNLREENLSKNIWGQSGNEFR